MQIKIMVDEEKTVDATTQQEVIKVLEKRLNALGTGEVILAPSGEDGVFLQMPGVGEEKRREIETEIQKVAQLEFSILHPRSFQMARLVAEGGQVVPGYEALPFKIEQDKNGNDLPQQYGLVKIKRDMEGEHVKSARHLYTDRGDSISVSFKSEGAKIMGPLTRAHTDEPLAIILDGVILSAPVINEPFAQGCLITGNFTKDEAEHLASALENPLGNPIDIEYSNFISPTMGEATI